eukprot:TRINITY_DN1380_c0_g1_i8.p2 TRINITY_DN1380_c0_g1~~TRINITY_DN1380_c0_g1_i8.p2  ORF type:complete len:120 (-),score=13.69 TRINITY_DN1380_c0_g1_i8:86-445(-)
MCIRDRDQGDDVMNYSFFSFLAINFPISAIFFLYTLSILLETLRFFSSCFIRFFRDFLDFFSIASFSLSTFLPFFFFFCTLRYAFISVFILPMYSALICLLYTSPSPRDLSTSRMPSSA